MDYYCCEKISLCKFCGVGKTSTLGIASGFLIELMNLSKSFNYLAPGTLLHTGPNEDLPLSNCSNH
jgi:hypothetical protein